MEIRELGSESAEKIGCMIAEIFSGDPWNDEWTEEGLRSYVFELLHGSNPLSLGLYEDGELIGISLGRIKHWWAGTEYRIDEFGILPAKQRRGAGRAFLEKIKGLLSERGIGGIVLLTERTAPAYRFYLENGFCEKEEQVFLAADIRPGKRD